MIDPYLRDLQVWTHLSEKSNLTKLHTLPFYFASTDAFPASSLMEMSKSVESEACWRISTFKVVLEDVLLGFKT